MNIPKDAISSLANPAVEPRDLLDAIPVVVTYLDNTYRYRYVNSTFESWFGIKRDSVIGKSIEEVLGKEVFSLIAKEVDAALSGERVQYEREISYLNGPKYVEVTYTPDLDESGTVKGYVGFIKDISERKRIQADLDRKQLQSQRVEELEQQRDFIQTILNHSVDLISVLDHDLRFLSVNSKWKEIYGLTDDVIGKSLEEVLTFNDHAETQDYFRQALSGHPVHIPAMKYGFNGRIYENFYISLHHHGKIYAVLNITHDITDITRSAENIQHIKNTLEEKNIELEKKNEVLRRQNEFVETILNCSQDLICVYDREGRFMAMNEKCRKLSWAGGDVIGKTFEEVYPSLIGSGVHEALRNTLNGKPLTNKIYKSEISGHTYSTYYIPLMEENKVSGALVVAHDDTDLYSMTDRLKQNNLQLERMTAEVEDYAILMLDKEGYILNWNKGAEKIKGYKAEEIVGKNFRIFYPPEAIREDLPTRLIHQAAEEGKATHEGWRVRKDGSRFWGSVVITALHDDRNELIGFTKVTRDLTERKLSEDQLKNYAEQLKRKNEELQHTNSELEQFAYVASHDLQEPLRKIQIFSTLLGNNLDNREQAEKYFGKISDSAKRMTLLIKALLNYSRVSKSEDQFVETDLNAVIGDVKADFELLIAEKNAVIRSRNLPVVTGIPLQLNQLFSNLLSNSLKFNNEVPVIDIWSEPVSKNDIAEKRALCSFVKIIFKDNGIGFDLQHADRIFTIFQRLNDRSYEGTGIGLAICKKIVQNHQGFIFAQSEKGSGATFTIFLPGKAENMQEVKK